MKQPSMSHRNDMARFFVASAEDERDMDDYVNAMSPVFGAIQTQMSKQRARLPKNDSSHHSTVPTTVKVIFASKTYIKYHWHHGWR